MFHGAAGVAVGLEVGELVATVEVAVGRLVEVVVVAEAAVNGVIVK